MRPVDALHSLFDANPLPMWIYEAEGLRFLAVNDAAVAVYGYSRDEFLRLTLADVRPPDEVDRLMDMQTPIEAPYRQVGLWRHRRKDGQIFDVEVSVHRTTHKGRPAMLALLVDASERNRARAQLERTAHRAMLLAEAGRRMADAEDEDTLTELLFAFAAQLVPLPHWWRNHFDLEDDTGATIRWTEGLLELFPEAHIIAPLRAESLHTGLNRRLHREKGTIHIPRCDDSLRYHDPAVDAHPLRTYLAIPMMYHDEVVGALIGGTFGDEGTRGLEPIEIQALENLVSSATQSILRIRAQASLERSQKLERGQRELLAMVAETRALPDVLLGIIAFVAPQGSQHCAAVVLKEDGRLAFPEEPALFSPPRSAVEASFRTCGPVVAMDPETCWAWPILARNGDPIGVLAVRPEAPRSPSPEERELLETAARVASLALEHHTLGERLKHQAHHDALTGLPNRVLMEDRLQQSVAQAERYEQQVALLFIDLDGFKLINDSLGHAIGDGLLRLVAARLSEGIRASDTLARMGGDEFTVLLHPVRDSTSAARVAEKLLESLREPFTVRGRELHVSASIGLAFYPQDGLDAATLLSHADAAMYRAKASGRNTCHAFTPELHDELEARMDLERQLHEALAADEFEVHYQPQFHTDGDLCGFEALVRWNHPQLGLVPPTKFIPAAEESGLILPIGRWVLEEACQQMVRWRAMGGEDLVMAVNVSAVQFADSGWVDTVAHTLARFGLPPHCLELELTESLVMDPASEAGRCIQRLKELGVGLAIDDFGTGYSSLSYLHRLPIGTLKIDQSFVRELEPGIGGRGGPIVQAIIALARSLQLQVIAEGVETEGQRAFLENLHCDVLQGFLLGRPDRAEAFDELVLANSTERLA